MRYASIKIRAGFTNSEGWMVAFMKGISIHLCAPRRECPKNSTAMRRAIFSQ